MNADLMNVESNSDSGISWATESIGYLKTIKKKERLLESFKAWNHRNLS